LRLLEHHFGDENVVWIGCFSPWKIAAMAGVPLQQALLEPPFEDPVRPQRGTRRLLAAER